MIRARSTCFWARLRGATIASSRARSSPETSGQHHEPSRQYGTPIGHGNEIGGDPQCMPACLACAPTDSSRIACSTSHLAISRCPSRLGWFQSNCRRDCIRSIDRDRALVMAPESGRSLRTPGERRGSAPVPQIHRSTFSVGGPRGILRPNECRDPNTSPQLRPKPTASRS
jgi:hypothetical protein